MFAILKTRLDCGRSARADIVARGECGWVRVNEIVVHDFFLEIDTYLLPDTLITVDKQGAYYIVEHCGVRPFPLPS